MSFEQSIVAVAILLYCGALVRQPTNSAIAVAPIALIALIWALLARLAAIPAPLREPSAPVEAYPLVLLLIVFAYRYVAQPGSAARLDRVTLQAAQMRTLALIATMYSFACAVLRHI